MHNMQMRITYVGEKTTTAISESTPDSESLNDI